MSLAADFMRVFRGAEGFHGTYAHEDPRHDSPKLEIKRTAKTLREPVSELLWQAHLSGTRPIGIVPINEDSVCYWGAIDIDDYTISHIDLVRTLAEHKIPAIVCKTKSGGAHIYLFFSEPIRADVVLPRLRELAAMLGHGLSEIFPKQERILIEKGDMGNWLNMPYFGGDRTERYALRTNGLGMSMSEFLAKVEEVTINFEVFLRLKFGNTNNTDFSNGPPCLEMLLSRGFPEGTRNNGLFALGVLAKKMRPDAWEDLLYEWNTLYLKPPLPIAEVQIITKSLRRKDYTYKCKDQPIVSFCNMAVCRKRPFGIGDGAAASIMESATVLKSDPPVYFVTLKTGVTIEVSLRQLMNYDEFRYAALQRSEAIPAYKTMDWKVFVDEIVKKAVEMEAPQEVGIIGRFKELLETFCTGRHRAIVREEVLLGKPWLDETTGRVYFRLQDLEQTLMLAKFTDYSRPQMSNRIRDMGGDRAQFNAKGKNINVWWIGADKLQWQTAAHDAPHSQEDAI